MEVFRIKTKRAFQFRYPRLADFQPLQQAFILLLVERATQKKLNFSFFANSMKASAIPSGVSWAGMFFFFFSSQS